MPHNNSCTGAPINIGNLDHTVNKDFGLRAGLGWPKVVDNLRTGTQVQRSIVVEVVPSQIKGFSCCWGLVFSGIFLRVRYMQLHLCCQQWARQSRQGTGTWLGAWWDKTVIKIPVGASLCQCPRCCYHWWEFLETCKSRYQFTPFPSFSTAPPIFTPLLTKTYSNQSFIVFAETTKTAISTNIVKNGNFCNFVGNHQKKNNLNQNKKYYK